MDTTDESNKTDGAAGAGKDPTGLPEVESPRLAPSQSATEHKVTTAVALFKGEDVNNPGSDTSEEWWVRRLMTRKVPPLAAAVALSLAIGALAGMFGAFASKDPGSTQANALNETVARLSAEIATLRAAQDSSAKTTGGQMTRMSERLDRAERTQSEPTAKIAKLSDTVERLERRVAALPAASSSSVRASSADVTGTISGAQPANSGKDLSRLPVVSGWTLQRVEDGRAYIYSREGMIEVAVGNALPGGGRVEAIRRQDGRWVVVTSRGVVVTR